MARTPIYIQNPDRVLVVRFESQLYVIPEPDLAQYLRTPYEGIASTEMDSFFSTHDDPVVKAAVVTTKQMMDGGPEGA